MPACISLAMRKARVAEKVIRQQIKRAQRTAQRLARKARRQVEARGRPRGTPGVSKGSTPDVQVGANSGEPTGAENAGEAADSEHTNKVAAQAAIAARRDEDRAVPQASPPAAGIGPREHSGAGFLGNERKPSTWVTQAGELRYKQHSKDNNGGPPYAGNQIQCQVLAPGRPVNQTSRVVLERQRVAQEWRTRGRPAARDR